MIVSITTAIMPGLWVTIIPLVVSYDSEYHYCHRAWAKTYDLGSYLIGYLCSQSTYGGLFDSKMLEQTFEWILNVLDS